MLKSFLRGVAAAAVVASALPAAAADWEPLKGDPTTVNFGIISTESSQNLKSQWEPFLKDMSKSIGLPVEGFYGSDYAAVIEAMRFGKVTVGWFGNASAIQAVDRAGAEVFARQAKVDGTQGYYSHIIAHADSKAASLKDMFAECGKGLAFGIGDPNSTSGFLVPSFYVFAKNDVDPKKCFGTVRNANHETNLLAVANGQVPYAANNSEQIARSMKVAPDAAKKVKVIWTSPLIPSDPIVFRRDLSDELKNRIRAFFLAYGRIGPDAEAQRKVLASFTDGLAPYSASSNAQLLPIRELALFKDRLKIEGDERMSADEKKAKLAAIDEALAKLRVLAGSDLAS
ncbi:MAG: phosphonate ABC transporter substrate-binding protein [Alphaproteobacteria bacterium]